MKDGPCPPPTPKKLLPRAPPLEPKTQHIKKASDETLAALKAAIKEVPSTPKKGGVAKAIMADIAIASPSVPKEGHINKFFNGLGTKLGDTAASPAAKKKTRVGKAGAVVTSDERSEKPPPRKA